MVYVCCPCCVGVMFLVVFRHGVRHIEGCAPVVTYPHLISLLQFPLLNFDVVAVGSPVIGCVLGCSLLMAYVCCSSSVVAPGCVEFISPSSFVRSWLLVVGLPV